jgi:hypothetical protein
VLLFVLSQEEIDELFAEAKPLSRNQRMELKEPKEPPINSRIRSEVLVQSAAKRRYEIVSTLCQSHPHKFSINVNYRITRRRSLFLLRLCGPNKGHINVIERRQRTGIQRIAPGECHIHYLTERYLQLALDKADGYAEPSSSLDSLESAVDYLAFAFGFYDPKERGLTSRFPLFPEA